MRRFGRICTLAVLGFGLSASASRAGEEKIPLDKVPKPVLSAFKAKFPGAKLNTAIKEEEGGKTVYELESTQGGLGIDAVLKPDGEFVEIERELKAADLPGPVTAAVNAKYPKAEVKKAEEVTKGTKVYYEVAVKTADGKDGEVVVDKNGKPVE